jgi:hypothetical protein
LIATYIVEPRTVITAFNPNNNLVTIRKESKAEAWVRQIKLLCQKLETLAQEHQLFQPSA